MPRDDDATSSDGSYVETGLRVAGGLLGPIPWILLGTILLEDLLGTTGYGIAFLAAPILWAGLALMAFLTHYRRSMIGWAAVGWLLWWSVGLW